MRIAAVVAVFVLVFVAGLVGVVAPAAGQTVPPATETPTATIECLGDCSIAPTPRPTDSLTTPAPDCAGECPILPTPRPPSGTPAPDCVGACIPFPTPRPTYAPGATIEPAGPDNGTGFWHYSFMPTVHLRH